MRPAELLAEAQSRGVEVRLTPAGDRLTIAWSEGDPPADLVDLIKVAKPQIVAELRRNTPTARKWRQTFSDNLTTVMRVRKLPRRAAEKAAYQNVIVEFLNDSMPANCDPNTCLWCRRIEEPGAPLIPLGVGRQTAWLHRDPCADRWRDHRRVEAIAKLAAMGIAAPAEDLQPEAKTGT
jgi:hypothetical protein